MRSLLSNWPEAAARLKAASRIAVFLDFDGTLAPIVPDPREAAMSRAARVALLRLAGNRRTRVWVISGRTRDDLRARVAVPGLGYLGIHGGDLEGANLSVETAEQLARARRELAIRLNGGWNGNRRVVVEDKGRAFAVHYRQAGIHEIERTRAILYQTVAESGGTLWISEGSQVWEVLPREIRGKGHAVRRLWRTQASGALPIYVGNDETDEAAFEELYAGITARVGAARPTSAHYFLRSPVEVGRFLEKLEENMRWKTAQPRSNS